MQKKSALLVTSMHGMLLKAKWKKFKTQAFGKFLFKVLSNLTITNIKFWQLMTKHFSKPTHMQFTVKQTGEQLQRFMNLVIMNGLIKNTMKIKQKKITMKNQWMFMKWILFLGKNMKMVHFTHIVNLPMNLFLMWVKWDTHTLNVCLSQNIHTKALGVIKQLDILQSQADLELLMTLDILLTNVTQQELVLFLIGFLHTSQKMITDSVNGMEVIFMKIKAGTEWNSKNGELAVLTMAETKFNVSWFHLQHSLLINITSTASELMLLHQCFISTMTKNQASGFQMNMVKTRTLKQLNF